MAKKAVIEKYLTEHPEHYDRLFEHNKERLGDSLCNMKANELREELFELWTSGCKGFEDPTYGPADLAADLADVNDDEKDDGEPIFELLYYADLISEDEFNKRCDEFNKQQEA